MNIEVRRVLQEPMAKSRLSAAQLASDFQQQHLRVIVPCAGTTEYEWRRTGVVVTLGELFILLGEKWAAAAIYYFYRTLRIVALKRRKNSSAGAPASGRATGLTGSEFQAAKIREFYKSVKTQLVDEYAAAMGIED